jgi:branched-chain amino acid transport system ATP-binding protein
MTLFEAQGVSVNFGALTAVSKVSFQIEPGERLALIGPNGAGKTTLFNAITGQLKPSAGKVIFKGQDITDKPVFYRTHLGMARSFQLINLFQQETVLINAMIGFLGAQPTGYRMWKHILADKLLRERAQGLLESIELWHLRDEFVSSLAYGQQRQLEIALALASDPELLLLDEPSCGLTTTESADITRRIRSLGKTITVLMIAHDMDLVFGVAERVILLHYGKIAAEGTCDEIRASEMVKDIYMGSRKTTFGRTD